MEELVEVAEFLSENPGFNWAKENPLDALGYAISITGTTFFGRAFQGAIETREKYIDALRNRNVQDFNSLRSEYYENLEKLSGTSGIGKVLLNPYKDGSIFGHLYGDMIWQNSKYDLENSKFSLSNTKLDNNDL